MPNYKREQQIKARNEGWAWPGAAMFAHYFTRPGEGYAYTSICSTRWRALNPQFREINPAHQCAKCKHKLAGGKHGAQQ